MAIDLALVWAVLIALAVLAYVVMDGFDLGVGILFPLFDDEPQRDLMINTIAPVWDGNETWLVLGGGGLYAVFPLAYATLLPALYVPLIVMLLGLIFRGVAFEFRWRTVRAKGLWDVAFFVGSLFAAFAQGATLGALVQGINVEGRAYVGGSFDWLTPFSVATGCALVIGYALLGSTWLIMKTAGDVRARARKLAWPCALLTLVLIAAVSLWSPFLNPQYLGRWFTWPALAFSGIVPLLLAGCTVLLLRGLRGNNNGNHDRDAVPFLASLGLFVLCYAGVLLSFYHIVPPNVTLWQAAAPDTSLRFLLTGAVVLLPLILLYTGYAYWVFRGKTDPAEGYH